MPVCITDIKNLNTGTRVEFWFPRDAYSFGNEIADWRKLKIMFSLLHLFPKGINFFSFTSMGAPLNLQYPP